MNVSKYQISAAMALLRLSQAELSEEANISPTTLSNMLRDGDAYSTKQSTINKVAQHLEEMGVEFLPNDGVCRKSQDVEIYEGPERFEDFHDFLYLHLKKYGGEVCLSIYDETILAQHRQNPELHRSRMRELVGSGKVSFRILTTQSSWKTRGYIQFKYLPDQQPSPTGFYAFGDCLALCSFVNPNSPYIVVLQSGPMTEAYRQSFNIAWNAAEEAPIIEEE